MADEWALEMRYQAVLDRHGIGDRLGPAHFAILAERQISPANLDDLLSAQTWASFAAALMGRHPLVTPEEALRRVSEDGGREGSAG